MPCQMQVRRLLLAAISLLMLTSTVRCRKKSEKSDTIVTEYDVSTSSIVYFEQMDSDRFTLIKTEAACGEAGKPPCQPVPPDSLQVRRLSGDPVRILSTSHSVRVTVDSTQMDAGKIIWTYKIEAVFETPLE